MNKENLRKEGKSPAKSKFAGINNILPRVLVDLGLDRRMHEQSLFSLWTSLLDPIYATRSTPLYIDNQGILIVGVENGSAAQELSFLKTKLLNQLQPIAVELGFNIKGMRFDLKQFSRLPDTKTIEAKYADEYIEKSIPSDNELAEMKLDEIETAKIASFKQELQATLEQSYLEKGSEYSTQKLERIVELVEKKIRFQKWCVRKNIPVCKQCAEPLPDFWRQSNRILCSYCAST